MNFVLTQMPEPIIEKILVDHKSAIVKLWGEYIEVGGIAPADAFVCLHVTDRREDMNVMSIENPSSDLVVSVWQLMCQEMLRRCDEYCIPVFIITYQQGQSIAEGCLLRQPNEPRTPVRHKEE